MKKTDLIVWASGIFDGEGCIYIERKEATEKRRVLSPAFQVNLSIGMIHKPTIIKLQKIFGVGYIYKGTTGHDKKRPYWQWHTSSNKAKLVLRRIYPYLVTKKSQADIAFKFFKSLDNNFTNHHGSKKLSYRTISVREKLRLQMKNEKQKEWHK